eukprot:TRINITY_DN32074_c0_g1_i1.p1 TRINITY_DN32074_c0_g1~~TRINITY_DN32074_c0_g1_i1.p1  ORF type:complete len:205 (+),score=95.95 TRINITY_DN32074_c0_g1_i1:50-616(+)
MGQGGSKKAPLPPAAAAGEDLLPEDEFLRESLLAFQDKVRDEEGEAARYEDTTVFAAREEQYSRAVIEEIEQRAETFKESLEENASQLEWRKWLHGTAAFAIGYGMAKTSRTTRYLSQLGPNAGHAKVVAQVIGCGMFYYHTVRFTEMIELQRQIAKREKMRLYATHIEKRGAFIYRPGQFVIPERKL